MHGFNSYAHIGGGHRGNSVAPPQSFSAIQTAESRKPNNSTSRIRPDASIAAARYAPPTIMSGAGANVVAGFANPDIELHLLQARLQKAK
jgi:hypothetical protein